METAEKTPLSIFTSAVKDMLLDFSNTFPEHTALWSKWTTDTTAPTNAEWQVLFDYCRTVFAERFFDIIYQNETMFEADSTINTYFLPDVDFKLLFNCKDISEKTRSIMWNYMKLILFSIVGSMEDKNGFGEAMNIFNNIDEKELHTKLSESFEKMTEIFGNIHADAPAPTTDAEDNGAPSHHQNAENGGASAGAGADFNEFFEKMGSAGGANTTFKDLPNMETLFDKLKGLFDGKIGVLAKEFAEEITDEYTDWIKKECGDHEIKDPKELIALLMKNPTKMASMVKKFKSKFEDKMKSGDITKEDIMRETGDIFSQMKDMGGKDAFMDMMKNMAKGMGKNTRMDTNAIEQINKKSIIRDRLKQKAQDYQQALQQQQQQTNAQQQQTRRVFTIEGEKQEKSTPEQKLLMKQQQENEINSILKDLGEDNNTTTTKVGGGGGKGNKKNNKKK